MKETDRNLDEIKEFWKEDYDSLVENGHKILVPMNREEFIETAINGGLIFIEKDKQGTYIRFKTEDERRT